MNDLKLSQLMIDHDFWSDPGPYSDVVLSTQVNLYRNIYYLPFPDMQEDKDIDFIKSIASKFIDNSDYSGFYNLLDLKDFDAHERRFLREKNIISPLMEARNNSLVIAGNKNNILLNEENHFNIQSMKPGLQISGAFKEADKLDDELNKFTIYAYSEELGYITANPGNLGAGLNVSIMMHLPVLTMTRNISELRNITGKYCVNIFGTRGDGAKTLGCIYKVLNSDSFGASEVEIIEKIDSAVRDIIEIECEARDNYVSEYGNKLEDVICRAYGILKFARILGYVEAMAYLSDVRLGIVLSIIKDIELHTINDLMINMQWAHLQRLAGRYFIDFQDCNIFRADYLRKQFNWSGAYE